MTTSSFIKACHDGDLEQAKQLLPDAEVNAPNEHGQGALLTFHPKVTEFLLANGADPNVQYNENGSSVLAGLSHVRKTECVRLLLAAGADPNKGRAESGETPLHHVLGSDPEIVSLLLEAGADPNIQAKTGIVSFNYGMDVRVRGETPFHRAAAYASIELIEKLLEAGADKTIRDANGDSPLSWGTLHRRERPILKLLSYGEYTMK